MATAHVPPLLNTASHRGSFILDVLCNYVTYQTYYRVATRDRATGEQEVDVGKAGAAIRRFAVRNRNRRRNRAPSRRRAKEHHLRDTGRARRSVTHPLVHGISTCLGRDSHPDHEVCGEANGKPNRVPAE
jgi:hypothetical protein